VLYSDVGGPIYERAGYAGRPAFDHVFTPQEGDPADGVDALVPEAGLAQALAAVPVPADPFVLRLSVAQLDWQLERERCYADLIGIPRAPSAGARVGGSVALWAWGRGALNVLVLHAGRRAGGPALGGASAVRMAGAFGRRAAGGARRLAAHAPSARSARAPGGLADHPARPVALTRNPGAPALPAWDARRPQFRHGGVR
jgi:hypothetical protein